MSEDEVLRVEKVTRTFMTTNPPARVLDGVDLTVDRGEFVAIMGASGSGKSTLLYCISGMDRPTSGEVILLGQELSTLSEAEASRVRLNNMGFVFQQPYFLDTLSIRDNIALPALEADSRDPNAAIARVDALMTRLGIDQIGGHGTTEASGGQLQRASICRALATEPDIVFADEPTGALNSTMTAEVMDALSDIHQDGTTLVLVTHSPACAARADRVVYLQDGRVTDTSTLGPWAPEESADREQGLLAWLEQLGF